MRYNNRREARNRLALVCVLPGQTGLYRFFDFCFFRFFPRMHTQLSETPKFAHDIVYVYMYEYMYISIYKYVNVYINRH